MPETLNAPARRPKRRVPSPTVVTSAPAQAATPADVLRHFRQVFNTVKGHFQQIERKSSVTGAQLWALSVIQRQPGVGTTELARAMDVHQSTASNLVRALSAAGLVESRRLDSDKRATQLHLLPAGVTALQVAPGPVEGVLPQALRQLSPDTLQRLHADLGELVRVLGADAHGSQVPLGQ